MRRSCSALTSEPQSRITAEIITELRRLYPQAHDGDLAALSSLRSIAPGAVPDVFVDSVRRALASFPRTSCASCMMQSTTRLATNISVHAVMGTGPARIQAVDLRSDYHGSSQSLDGCVRPIAVGETIRRIVGKVAVEFAQSYLQPFNVGVLARTTFARQ